MAASYRPRVDRPTHGAAPGVSPAVGRPLPPPGDEFDRTDPGFRDDLAQSQPAVAAVGRYFAAHGYPVVIPEPRVRPTPAERAAYRDSGDGYVGRAFEVKWCAGFAFTSRETFPYPTVLLGAVYEFDRARPLPWLVFSVSQDRRYALAVNVARTKARWEVRPVYAPRLERDEPCYFCPKELTLLVELPPEDA